MPVAAATTADASQWITQRTDRVLLSRVESQVDYATVDYTGAVAIVLGSEAAGLSRAWRGETALAVRLPMHGAADSLNVASAARRAALPGPTSQAAQPGQRRVGAFRQCKQLK